MNATAFSFEPLFLVLAVAAAFLYWRAARAESPPRWRLAATARIVDVVERVLRGTTLPQRS